MRKSTEKGSVLIGVLILVVIVVLVMGTVASFITHGIHRTQATSARLQALYLAEAGVEKAIEQLKEDWDNTFPTPSPSPSSSPSPSYSPFPSGDEVVGEYGFIIPPPDEGSGERIIEGYGKVKIAGREVEEKVEVEVISIVGLPAFDYALFAGNSITIGNTPKIVGDVATNTKTVGNVEFTGNATIVGNLYIGPEGDPDNVIETLEWLSLEDCFGEVEPGKKGEVRNLTKEIIYPPPEFPNYPTGLDEWGNLEITNPATIDTDGYYGSIIVHTTKLYIDTGSDPNEERIILVDNLEMSGGDAHIVLQGSGKLKLYVRNKFDISNSGHNTINYGTSGEGDPARVTLYYGGAGEFNLSNDAKINGTVVVNDAKVVIGGSGALIAGGLITGGNKEITIKEDPNSMNGVIYAPNAKVILTTGGGIKGAVVCQDFESTNGKSCLSYDESVQDIELPAGVLPPPGSGGIFITSWQSESITTKQESETLQ